MAYIGKSPTGSAVRSRFHYTATGGETSLSGTDDNNKTLKFTDGEYLDVYLNGILLVQGTDYGVGTANTISSLTALAANDIVEIVVYDVYNVAKINSEAMRHRWYYTATGGETSVGTSQISNLVFPANAEIEVSLNGISLVAGTDYNTTSANTVGGLAALTAGQVVEIIYYEAFVLADTVSKASGGTFAKAIAVNGDLTVDTDTLHVDATNNRVGVGTTAPVANLQVVGSTTTDVALLGTSGTRLTVEPVDSIGEVKLKIDDPSGNNYHKFMTFHTEGGSGTTEKLRILATGGITFNGDTASANALDDYEEGTWTPTVTTSTSVDSTSSGHGAHYTKVGNLVTFVAYILWTNNQNNDSNTFFIGGLPFDNISDYGLCNVGYVGSANMNDAAGVVNANDDNVYFHQNDGNSSALNNSDITSRGLTTIIISGSYFTSS